MATRKKTPKATPSSTPKAAKAAAPAKPSAVSTKPPISTKPPVVTPPISTKPPASPRVPPATTKPTTTVPSTTPVKATTGKAPQVVMPSALATAQEVVQRFASIGYVPGAFTLPIEIGDRPVANVIIRDGSEITTPEIDVRKVDAYIGNLTPIIAVKVPRVLSQSVATGTRVLKGTAVDLVLVPPTDVELGILKDPHIDFQHKTVDVVQPILLHAQVAPILEQFSKASDLSPAQKTQVTAVLSQNGINIDDSKPSNTFDAAFRMLRGAKAYT